MVVTRVDISGFGRIDRNLFRAALERGADIEIAVVNDLTDNKIPTHLLKYDSITGHFQGEVSHDDRGIVVDGRHIKVFVQRGPTDLLWGEFGVEIVVESVGFFTDGEEAEAHLDGGAKKAAISAPVKNASGTFAAGVNEADYDNAMVNIASNASCMTNCLAPFVEVLEENFGVKCGIMTTIRLYMGGQRVLDALHSDLRHARAMALNMIPIKTGVAQAVVLVLPALGGKFDNLVVRVPILIGSLINLILITKNEVSVKVIKVAVKATVEDKLKGILKYIESPIIPSGIVGDPYTPIFDAIKTRVIGNLVKVLSWCDNEWGYSDAFVRLTALVGSKLV